MTAEFERGGPDFQLERQRVLKQSWRRRHRGIDWQCGVKT